LDLRGRRVVSAGHDAARWHAGRERRATAVVDGLLDRATRAWMDLRQRWLVSAGLDDANRRSRCASAAAE
jgi:hypothetical protein